MNYRVISIGTLSHNELWGETAPQRTAHATTTLVRSKDRVLIVDPGLPPEVIGARLKERSGLDPSAVTDVFLTNFRPAHRWGLAAFAGATWHISEMEREAIGRHLIAHHDQAESGGERELFAEEIAILKRCRAAADRLMEQVDLFPLSGFTPGTCGLLLLHANSTTLVAGDAIPTVEHLEHGRLLPNCYDAQTARESFLEAIEIADVIVPGHDNMILNPSRRPM